MWKYATLAVFALTIASSAAAESITLFSSFPGLSNSRSSVTPNQQIAVHFRTPDVDAFLREVSLRFALQLSFIPGTEFPVEPLPVEVQLWDNKLISVGPTLRNRPNQMMGTWLSTPIDSFNYNSPSTITATAADEPLLTAETDYWLKVLPTWTSSSIYGMWDGSAPFDGFGYGLEMVSYPSIFNPDGDNFDGGGFLAFEVVGTVADTDPVPESSSLILISMGLFSYGVYTRFGLRKSL